MGYWATDSNYAGQREEWSGKLTYDPHQGQYPPRQPYRGQWPPQQQQPQYPPQYQPPPGYQVQPYAQPYPPPQQWQQPAAPPVSPALIVILSFLIPGLGSIVGRSYVHGSIILAAFLISAFLVFFAIGIFLVPVTWLWGMIAACVLVSRQR
jgi:TM2 domain-containing membrane protein YozV